MGYADWKNDFTFYKIFAHHPDVLRDLLNDLLDLKDQQAITGLEYLPRDQAPDLPGGRRAIVDVKCREVSGRVFIVEMQLFSHTAFVDRVVYNACRALVSQLAEGDEWRKLADVVAVAICNFTIWSDKAQDHQGEPRIPLVSRWRMTEEQTGAHSLDQVRYVFLELPKLGDRPPANAKETWAWLFRQASKLASVPGEVSEPMLSESQRKALKISNKATFTPGELETYERMRQEIVIAAGIVEQALLEGEAKGEAKGHAAGLAEGEAQGHAAGLAEGETKGHAAGLNEGLLRGKREALLQVLALRGIGLTAEQRDQIEACTEPARLGRWFKQALTAKSAEELGG